MGHKVVRGAVALAGLVLAAIGVAALLDANGTGAKLGLSAINALGHATLRADIAAFFLTAGGLAMAAAARREPLLLTAPLLLISLTLCGRLLSVLLTGFDAAMVPPMAVEALLVAVFLAGRRMGPA